MKNILIVSLATLSLGLAAFASSPSLPSFKTGCCCGEVCKCKDCKCGTCACCKDGCKCKDCGCYNGGGTCCGK